MKRITITILLSIGYLFLHSQHQNLHFSFRHYNQDNGFPLPRIYGIKQDKNGYLWCASNTGIVKFDGNDFHLYSYDPLDSFSLPFSKTYDLVNGNSELILIKTSKSIFYYDPAIDGFRKLFTDSANTSISSVPFCYDNEIWFAANNKKLKLFDRLRQTSKEFASSPKAITSIMLDENKTVWLGTHDGLYKFNRNKNNYELFWKDSVHTEYGYSLVSSLKMDGDDIWFTSYNGGIGRINRISREHFFIDFKSQHTTNSNFYGLDNINLKSFNGIKYLFCSSNDGMVLFNINQMKYEGTISPEEDVTNDVSEVFFDRSGTLWLSSHRTLYKSERAILPVKIVKLPILEIKDSKIKLDDEQAAFEAKSLCKEGNYIWIGTNSKGLLKYEISSGSIVQQILTKDKTGEVLTIAELFKDSKNRIWASTAYGIFVFNPGNNQLRNLSKENIGKDSLADAQVSEVCYEDAGGNVWVPTERGVSVYDAQLNFVKNIREQPGGLKGSFVFSIYPYDENKIWILTRNVNLYDRIKNEFVNDIDKIEGLPAFAMEITSDRKNGFYFNSTNSIEHFKKGSVKVESLPVIKTIREGISKTFVDSKGRLWLSTIEDGLIKIDLETNNKTHFTKRSGLPSDNWRYATQSNDGYLLSPTHGGFVYFHPDSVKADTTVAPVEITGIHIMEEKLKANYNDFADSVLSLSYKQNIIRFDFSLMDFSYSDDVHYEYKLEGFNDNWLGIDKEHAATYTNLDPGTYTFRVRAKNHDGFQSPQEATIKLKIVPPFWKTWGFIAGVVLLVASILFFWIKSLQLKIRSQKILNQIATSLYGQNTIEEIFWDVSRDCVNLLGFVDCVVYVKDDKRQVLIQKAAYGPKNKEPFEIYNPIELPVGTGIVGRVAKTGIVQRVADTSKHPGYIIDDEKRLSELAVPIIVDGNVFGVIDSEHPLKNFYTNWHEKMLKEIAAICAAKISLQVVQDRIRSKIARDLHDDMGSALSSINIISKMALEHSKSAEQVSDHLKKIKENSGSMLESMSDIVWAISPSNDTLEKVIYRMKEFAADILEPLNIQYNFVEDGDFKNVQLDLNKRKDFYLVFKEAINNAAKYSHCNRISIYLRNEGGEITMLIEDDGSGFDLNKAKTGNGLRNMEERAHMMNGKIRIKSHVDEGTSVELRLRSHD